jgi:hypothetical protein
VLERTSSLLYMTGLLTKPEAHTHISHIDKAIPVHLCACRLVLLVQAAPVTPQELVSSSSGSSRGGCEQQQWSARRLEQRRAWQHQLAGGCVSSSECGDGWAQQQPTAGVEQPIQGDACCCCWCCWW